MQLDPQLRPQSETALAARGCEGRPAARCRWHARSGLQEQDQSQPTSRLRRQTSMLVVCGLQSAVSDTEGCGLPGMQACL